MRGVEGLGIDPSVLVSAAGDTEPIAAAVCGGGG